MIKSKKLKKILAGLLATVTIMPAVLSLGSNSAQAATPTTNVTVDVHKGQYTTSKPSWNNNGEDKPSGYTPLDTDTYGKVTFSIVKVTDLFDTELKKLGATLTRDNATQAQLDAVNATISTLAENKKGTDKNDLYKDFFTETGVDSSTRKNVEVVKGTDTVSSFTNVANDGVYIVLETKITNKISTMAIPMLVHLPMTNKAGDDYLAKIDLYAKNQVTNAGLDFVKKGEVEETTNKTLEGAIFDLYSGTPGSGTKISTHETKADGTLNPAITGLADGNYYLVETGFKSGTPGKTNGYMLSPNALNDTNNKLNFTVTAGNAKGEFQVIGNGEFMNYVEPEAEKDATNGTPSKVNNHPTFDIGDTVNYTAGINLPTDINGAILSDDGAGNITYGKPYTIFNYKDTPKKGLTFNGPSSAVKVYIDVDGDGKYSTGDIDLADGTDYNYSGIAANHVNPSDPYANAKDRGAGFKLDFIVGTGTNNVSAKIKAAAIAGQNVLVDYGMIVNVDAVIDSMIENEFTLSFDNDNGTGEHNETGFEEVMTGGKKFLKKGDDGSALKDAQFLVKNKDGDYYGGIVSGKVVWGTKANAQGTKDGNGMYKGPGVLTSGTDGKFEIKGLEHGNYTLEEIRVPEGYQLPTNGVSFEIDEDSYTNPAKVLEVLNKKKPTLPITGGMGTLLFTIVGLVVMGGAVLYTVKNRRKEA